MPPRPDQQRPDLRRRDELLAALVDVCARDGLGRRSMRELAGELGTSHRMLIHHFGSRNDMLVAVVQEVERRQSELLTSIGGSGHVGEQFWAALADPAVRPFERLFFECYARGVNGEAPFDRLLPGAVTDWLASSSDDPAMARLALAVVRGLLLDLVATDDELATTAAMAAFIDLVRSVQFVAREPDETTPSS